MFHQRNIGLTCLKVQVMDVAGMSKFGLVLGVSARLSAKERKVRSRRTSTPPGRGRDLPPSGCCARRRTALTWTELSWPERAFTFLTRRRIMRLLMASGARRDQRFPV